MTEARIKTILSADSKDFEAGVKRAERALANAEGKFRSSAGKMEGSFASLSKNAGRNLLAAFSVGALVSFGKGIVELGGQLKDLSQETGIAASTLSALRSPLEQSGSSINDFAAATVKLNKAISEAATGGSKELLATFDELGLSVTRLRTLSPEDQLFEIVAALGKVKDQGDLTRLGVDLFGKSFRGLIPIIKESSGDLAQYTREAEAAGNALTQEQVDRLDSFGDALTGAGIAIQNVVGGAFADLLKVLDATGISLNDIYGVIKLIDPARGIKNVAKSLSPKDPFEGLPPLPPLPKVDRPRENNNDIKRVTATINGAEKLRESLLKLQQETSRDIYTSGMTELELKLKQVDFSVADLARQYKTKLTPEMQKQVETIKENVRLFDQLQREEKEAEKLATDLGGAFSDAFEDGVLGAEKFSDVLGALGSQIEKILFNQIVTQPLNSLFGEFARGISSGGDGGGIGDILDSIGDGIMDFLPSYATGIKKVPYDMNARLHAGETVLTAQETRSMGSGNSSPVNVTVINNAGAEVKTSTKRDGNGTELTVMVDQAVAKNIANQNSQTAAALQAREQRTLTRRG